MSGPQVKAQQVERKDWRISAKPSKQVVVVVDRFYLPFSLLSGRLSVLVVELMLNVLRCHLTY